MKTCAKCGGALGIHNVTGYCPLCVFEARRCSIGGCANTIAAFNRSGFCHEHVDVMRERCRAR